MPVDLRTLLLAKILAGGSGGGGGDASNKVDKNQGLENANEVLVTDDTGHVTTVPPDELDFENVEEVSIDDVPTAESSNPVASGGVYDAVTSVVEVGDTQPTSDFNEIWIDSDAETVQVPTMDDLPTVPETTNIMAGDGNGGLTDSGINPDLVQKTSITDEDGYFTTDTVEGALAEIGAELAGINTLIGSGVIE